MRNIYLSTQTTFDQFAFWMVEWFMNLFADPNCYWIEERIIEKKEKSITTASEKSKLPIKKKMGIKITKIISIKPKPKVFASNVLLFINDSVQFLESLLLQSTPSSRNPLNLSLYKLLHANV